MPAQMTTPVQPERRGGIALVTLARPETRNALRPDPLERAAPLAVRAALRALREGADRPAAEGIDAARRALAPILAPADLRAGIAAVLDQRAPAFTGR